MNKNHEKAKSPSAKESQKTTANSMHEADSHAVAKQHRKQPADVAPPAEYGSHSRSMAAHLDPAAGGGKQQTRPKGNLSQGAPSGALREPPMTMQRTGKQHK